MLKTAENLLHEMNTYGNPRMRIKRMANSGKIIRVRRGLYEDNPNCPPEALSGAIYGPSYLSFEYALARYDMIPERVVVYTAATLRKNRRKSFVNHFGTYTYRDIPASAYPYGITAQTENGYSWLMASPEKALCDTLYIKKPVSGINEMQGVMFDSMRMEREDIKHLNWESICFLCERYPAVNLKILKDLKDKL